MVELFAREANIGDDVFLARIEDCLRLQFVKLARDRGHALDRTLLRTGGYLPFLLGRLGLAAIEPLPQPALFAVEVVAGISAFDTVRCRAPRLRQNRHRDTGERKRLQWRNHNAKHGRTSFPGIPFAAQRTGAEGRSVWAVACGAARGG